MSAGPRTMVEKIAGAHVVGDADAVRPGAFVRIRPKHVMTHDNTAAVIPKFRAIGKGHPAMGREIAIADSAQPVFAIDHDIQNHTPENLGKYAKIESFARAHHIDYYKPGTGIGHQVMCERGYVTPASMVVASDSHANLYGALGCLGTPVVRTDAAVIWATGTTWWRVPPIARVHLTGTLPDGVSGKDVIVALCGTFNRGEVLNHAVEFVGEAIGHLSIAERMAICNMTTEWGALAGVMPADARTFEWLHQRAASANPRTNERLTSTLIDDLESRTHEFAADTDATYAIELELDCSTLSPAVVGPNSVDTLRSVDELERKRIPIQKAYLLSCVNGRLEDLRAAAAILRGHRVAEGVALYVAPASAEVRADAETDSTWQTLMDAGAIELPPGCGPCIGLGAGTAEAGEIAISATNRNFEGRMGSRDAQVYLASPAVVAASAAAGFIASPNGATPRTLRARVVAQRHPEPIPSRAAGARPRTGRPTTTPTRGLFLDRDSINTDAIYAGKWTYTEGMTPEEMAAVLFENYDPAIAGELRAGDVLFAGANFGTGSSREQAATALKAASVRCVVAASCSETYRRNAFNNGFVIVECAHAIEHLRSAGRAGIGWRVIDQPVSIDLGGGWVAIGDHRFDFAPLPEFMQQLINLGGAEALAARWLAESPIDTEIVPTGGKR
ncbi:MAG: aconitase family protein [Planctomycetota bacterium]